jgi:hypothetical protein
MWLSIVGTFVRESNLELLKCQLCSPHQRYLFSMFLVVAPSYFAHNLPSRIARSLPSLQVQN